jgi:hypothetical protein
MNEALLNTTFRFSFLLGFSARLVAGLLLSSGPRVWQIFANLVVVVVVVVVAHAISFYF